MKSDDNIPDPIERAYNSGDKKAYYSQWASSYDVDMATSGYVAPVQAVELFKKIVSPDAGIIEFGCGTGQVGEQLVRHNYHQVAGIDHSPQMLEKAAQRGCYGSLREHDLTEPLLDDIRYDAGICVGVLAFGPLMAAHLAHMTSVLREHAPLILTINGRAWDENNWASQLEEAQQKNRFFIEYINTIPYLTDAGIDGKLLIIRNGETESEAHVPEQ